jgi:hypothetical protein
MMKELAALNTKAVIKALSRFLAFLKLKPSKFKTGEPYASKTR